MKASRKYLVECRTTVSDLEKETEKEMREKLLAELL